MHECYNINQCFFKVKLTNASLLLQVKVGDTLDFILDENKEMGTVNLKRVIFKKVLGETRDADKYKVILRTWKNLHLPRKDVYKD